MARLGRIEERRDLRVLTSPPRRAERQAWMIPLSRSTRSQRNPRNSPGRMPSVRDRTNRASSLGQVGAIAVEAQLRPRGVPGYDVIITKDRNQLSDPGECDVIKRSAYGGFAPLYPPTSPPAQRIAWRDVVSH
jgi:hypothetical protein